MALVEFLKSGQLKPPRAVTVAAKKDSRGVGFVVPSFRRGSLMLKDADGRMVRLSWEDAEKKKAKKADAPDQRRALAPGTYTLIGYRILRTDKEGKPWFISATSPHGIRKLTVREGQINRVQLSSAVHIQCKVRATGEGIRVMAGVQGEHHSGLSIYRDGKRIAMHYVVRGSGGKKLSTGKMEYG
ncbi:MAG: hypothetical protein IID44_04295 [Planctomycetes bacterium]|nr:hypothetical protein [Planctomycetota bacterium]